MMRAGVIIAMIMQCGDKTVHRGARNPIEAKADQKLIADQLATHETQFLDLQK